MAINQPTGFVTIPGFSMLKKLPPQTKKPSQSTVINTRLTQADYKRIETLISIALNTAYGLRPMSSLHFRIYDLRVREHLSHIRQTYRHNTARISIQSLHYQRLGHRVIAFGTVAETTGVKAYSCVLYARETCDWYMKNFLLLTNNETGRR
ncbi:Uncharacterised protein [Corynebacterium kutscheri]|uniref:Uncharacterized protein n=1 Tax=Corynebacterium kutscheri TaxID=35755 RepID=A0A0F6TD03_9CORY|nr:hypothetical protein [Corynebacterium kutscheri]AKE40714.1 hypothetical protein UL82_02445 [Corynebacterium kutscheri]VEH11111.1 Uncharacterised protein [Corynebacterium kutscheri]VEH80411.1 Uncharacterised protein [Corynebacterium kutscheri]